MRMLLLHFLGVADQYRQRADDVGNAIWRVSGAKTSWPPTTSTSARGAWTSVDSRGDVDGKNSSRGDP